MTTDRKRPGIKRRSPTSSEIVVPLPPAVADKVADEAEARGMKPGQRVREIVVGHYLDATSAPEMARRAEGPTPWRDWSTLPNGAAVALYEAHGWVNPHNPGGDKEIGDEVRQMLSAGSDKAAAAVIRYWGCWESDEDLLDDVRRFRRRNGVGPVVTAPTPDPWVPSEPGPVMLNGERRDLHKDGLGRLIIYRPVPSIDAAVVTIGEARHPTEWARAQTWAPVGDGEGS